MHLCRLFLAKGLLLQSSFPRQLLQMNLEQQHPEHLRHNHHLHQRQKHRTFQRTGTKGVAVGYLCRLFLAQGLLLQPSFPRQLFQGNLLEPQRPQKLCHNHQHQQHHKHRHRERPGTKAATIVALQYRLILTEGLLQSSLPR